MNPSTREGEQLALFGPDCYVNCWGLSSYTARAGDRKDSNQLMRGRQALTHRFIQANPHGMLNMLVIDVDRPSAIMDLLERPKEWPDPSFIVETEHGAHATWALDTPVCRTDAARQKPIRYAARVEKGLVRAINADRGYTGYMTRNPVYPHLRPGEVIWGAGHLYALAELATEVMPRQLKRRPEHVTGDLGRNVSLFHTVRQEVYALNRKMGYPGFDRLFGEVKILCEQVNERFAVPLPAREPRDTAKSIARWVATHHTRDGFTAAQTRRGRNGGLKGGRANVDKRRSQLTSLAEELEYGL